MSNNNIKNLKRENGLMLIELLISLVLLGLVLSVGYLFLSFGMQSFSRGENQAIAQTATRQASDFITGQLRFATEIVINPSSGVQVNGYRYIYLENESIYYKDEVGNVRVIADSMADEMPFNIEFSSSIPYDVVYFDIEADNGLYILSTGVQAINLQLQKTYDPNSPEELITLNDGDGSTLKYKVSMGQ